MSFWCAKCAKEQPGENTSANVLNHYKEQHREIYDKWRQD